MKDTSIDYIIETEIVRIEDFMDEEIAMDKIS